MEVTGINPLAPQLFVMLAWGNLLRVLRVGAVEGSARHADT
jgi:hypothetical protein